MSDLDFRELVSVPGAGDAATSNTALGRIDLADAYDRAQEYADASHAPSTCRMLAVHWKEFSAWCHRAGVEPLPASPATVALYLSSVAGELATSTLGRRLWAITTMPASNRRRSRRRWRVSGKGLNERRARSPRRSGLFSAPCSGG